MYHSIIWSSSLHCPPLSSYLPHWRCHCLCSFPLVYQLLQWGGQRGGYSVGRERREVSFHGSLSQLATWQRLNGCQLHLQASGLGSLLHSVLPHHHAGEFFGHCRLTSLRFCIQRFLRAKKCCWGNRDKHIMVKCALKGLNIRRIVPLLQLHYILCIQGFLRGLTSMLNRR